MWGSGSVRSSHQTVSDYSYTLRQCFTFYFYRATLCVSAVFAVARCPSVRLSRWCIVSTRLKISSNFFVSPVAPPFSFFDPQRRYPIPKGNHSPGAQNIILGYRKLLQVCLAVAKPGPEGLNILKNLQVPKRVTCVAYLSPSR